VERGIPLHDAGNRGVVEVDVVLANRNTGVDLRIAVGEDVTLNGLGGVVVDPKFQK
jgi:hypothetical protein